MNTGEYEKTQEDIGRHRKHRETQENRKNTKKQENIAKIRKHRETQENIGKQENMKNRETQEKKT